MVSVRQVWNVIRDGRPRSAVELVAEVGGGTTASVTARVRDLRKPEYGEHDVRCVRGADGVPRYFLRRNAGA